MNYLNEQIEAVTTELKCLNEEYRQAIMIEGITWNYYVTAIGILGFRKKRNGDFSFILKKIQIPYWKREFRILEGLSSRFMH